MNQTSPEYTLPPLTEVRPLVMLTGFLGAGKTTLLRRTLEALKTYQIDADVILNDRENAELDCETLRDFSSSITALSGGCICCEALDELASIILATAGSRHEMMFIELNGTGDPLPLLESFTLLESRFLLRPRWQVAVIDARNFQKRGRYNGLEALQLETASHYHLTHTDELSAAEKLRLLRHIEAVNPRASATDPNELASQISRAVSRGRRHTIAQPGTHPRFTLPSPYGFHDRHTLSHEFTGCQIRIPEPLAAHHLICWLTQLPGSVVRAKALARTTDDASQRFLFERVGIDVMPGAIPVPIRDHVPSSAILIGPDLDPIELLASARQHLGNECCIAS